MGSLSIWHWLIVLAVVVLIFGTKKLKNLGSDLGGAVKGFKDGMKGEQADAAPTAQNAAAQAPAKVTNVAAAAADNTIDVQAKQKL